MKRKEWNSRRVKRKVERKGVKERMRKLGDRRRRNRKGWVGE